MRWTIATAARTIETIGATWDEVDQEALGGPVWVVPAWRMKEGNEHRVPLNSVALLVLDAAAKLRGTLGTPALIFPGGAVSRGGRVLGGRPRAVTGGLSNEAVLALLRRMGVHVAPGEQGLLGRGRFYKVKCSATRFTRRRSQLDRKFPQKDIGPSKRQ
jgi:integrase